MIFQTTRKVTNVILPIEICQVKVSRMFNRFFTKKSPGIQPGDLIFIYLHRICLIILVSKLYINTCLLSLTIFEEVSSNLREQSV